MIMTLVLLAVLFIAGLVHGFFHVPPKKFVGWVVSFLPDKFPVISTTRTMAPKEKSADDKAELERVFATFDKNGDGSITKEELREFLKSIGFSATETEVVSMVERLDANGDGLIDLNEFCELYQSIGIGQEARGRDGEEGSTEYGDDDLREAFDVFDGNGDGLITVEELGLVLSSLGLQQGMKMEYCKEMIKKVDMDGDGMVNFEEFKRMMKAGQRLTTVS